MAASGLLPLQAQTTFYTTIRNNDLAGLRQLVKKSGPNAGDSRHTSPLMYAAALGSLDAMKLLVEAGADVNSANDFGATALMWCAGDLAKARYLLSMGADVKARSKVGRTPLMIAANCDGSVEIARLMIEKGADVKAKDEGGASVLETAATVNNLEVARLLLANGADVNTVDKDGFTPLGQAAGNGDRATEMVRLFLDHGAQVNVASGDTVEIVKNGPIRIGWMTPLQMAAPQANFETVELLVKAGADVNAKDIRGLTPLALAVATDHADPRIVRLLLEHGASPAIKSAEGETALDWARKYNNPEVMRVLGAPVSKAVGEPLQASPSTARSVPAAIETAVALMQSTSSKFLDNGGCLSCHAQHLTGLAVAAARETGVKVDTALETAQARVTASLRGSLEQTLFQVVDPTAGVDSQQFSLMQMASSAIPPTLSTDALVCHIAAMQRKEGDWPNYGLARPPLEDGGFQHTAKGIRSLRLHPIPARKAEFEERIARAAAWLEKQTPVSTEDRTMQILGIAWAGHKAPQDRVTQLIALQRNDGGWGQTNYLPSDAYATGEALYALHETGMGATDPVYRKGVEYLLHTQREDGSWHVKTRAADFQPYFQSGFPHGHDQWISQAGTAWAVIALSYAALKPGSVAALQ
jgi:ankyrin repeat protein